MNFISLSAVINIGIIDTAQKRGTGNLRKTCFLNLFRGASVLAALALLAIERGRKSASLPRTTTSRAPARI